MLAIIEAIKKWIKILIKPLFHNQNRLSEPRVFIKTKGCTRCYSTNG